MLELKYGTASWIYSLSAIAIWQVYCAFYQYAEQRDIKASVLHQGKGL